MTYHIEDLLHYLVDTVGVTDNDAPILQSISRQCKKGTALTDRQYQLVLTKLQTKADILAEHNLTVDNNPPRLPLREIDRSKYITVVSHSDIKGPNSVYESYKQDFKWIKIRFPFTKKLIVQVENLANKYRRSYHHQKGSHEHYFRVTPLIAKHIYETFKDKSFEIDEVLIEYVNKVYDIESNKVSYIPCVKNGEFLNATKTSAAAFENEVALDASDVVLKDRSRLYGYEFDYTPNSTLADILAARDSAEVLVKPDEYNINQVVETLYTLNRWPIVIPVDDNKSFDQVYEMYRAFNGLVDSSEQSVLFRVDSNDKTNVDLNDFVKTNTLNNWVDSNTKIVYINKNKMPKVLLNSGFRPKTALYPTSLRSNTNVNTWIKFCCDLIIYHDTDFSSFKHWRGFSSW